jgi:hypothetical protein
MPYLRLTFWTITHNMGQLIPLIDYIIVRSISEASDDGASIELSYMYISAQNMMRFGVVCSISRCCRQSSWLEPQLLHVLTGCSSSRHSSWQWGTPSRDCSCLQAVDRGRRAANALAGWMSRNESNRIWGIWWLQQFLCFSTRR